MKQPIAKQKLPIGETGWYYNRVCLPLYRGLTARVPHTDADPRKFLYIFFGLIKNFLSTSVWIRVRSVTPLYSLPRLILGETVCCVQFVLASFGGDIL